MSSRPGGTSDGPRDARGGPGEGGPNLASRVVEFVRLLRRMGLPVGPGRGVVALRALDAVDATRPREFYWALHAVLVHRPEHREPFELAFRAFWREPGAGEIPPGLAELLEASRLQSPASRPAAARRLADALGDGRDQAPREREREPRESRVRLAWSDREVLRTRDFEQMSAEELEEARAMLSRVRLPLPTLPGRRSRPHARGRRVDLRASMRASLRQGGDLIPLRRRQLRRRTPDLVVLCDISGSMTVYSRMLLHFVHAVSDARQRVHAFLFATRLTPVSRQLRHRDPDVALEAIGERARDWGGGTRLGACLGAFNRRWGRRVLARGAVVLLISDGLDREGGAGLAREMDRLQRSCRRLVWLNPLLRYREFEPRAAGIRAMLPRVDDFRPAHDVASLEALAVALGDALSADRRAPRVSPLPSRSPTAAS